jgi:hypothetical protein
MRIEKFTEDDRIGKEKFKNWACANGKKSGLYLVLRLRCDWVKEVSTCDKIYREGVRGA